MMCRFVPVCEESRPMSSDLSLVWVGGGGVNERKTDTEGGAFEKDVAQETV